MMYITLFWEFFKIGLFAVGGGLATLPFMQRLIDQYGWITNQDLIDMIAISESTPGPIGINLATYMGVKTTGIWGGCVATLGMMTPSVIIIVIIAKLFEQLSEEPWVKACFYGIRPVVTGFIAAIGFGILQATLFHNVAAASFDLPAIVLFAVLAVLIHKLKWHPVFYLLAAAMAGIFIL